MMGEARRLLGMDDNPLVGMEVFTRKYPVDCPDCGSDNFKRLAFFVPAKWPYPDMWIDENTFQCQAVSCGVIWDEDGDP
jgi:hypothetical protein